MGYFSDRFPGLRDKILNSGPDKWRKRKDKKKDAKTKSKDVENKKTAYYDDATGEFLEYQEGQDIAIGLGRLIFDSLKSDGELTVENVLKFGGGNSLGKNSDFEIISATVYAEGSRANLFEEYESIAWVLKNRYLNPIKNKTKDFSIVDIIKWKPSQVDGYNSPNYKAAIKRDEKNFARYSKARHTSATKATMIMLTNPQDKSGGAFFWSSLDNKYFDKQPDNYVKIKEVKGNDPEGNETGSKFYKTNPDNVKIRHPW